MIRVGAREGDETQSPSRSVRPPRRVRIEADGAEADRSHLPDGWDSRSNSANAAPLYRDMFTLFIGFELR